MRPNRFEASEMEKTAADDGLHMLIHIQFTVKEDPEISNNINRLYNVSSNVQVQINMNSLLQTGFWSKPNQFCFRRI